MRFVIPIKFANQLRSKNLFVKMNQFRTTQINLLLPNTLKPPELISQTYGLIHTNGGGGKFPTKEEKRKILIEAFKDNFQTVAKRYNLSISTLSEWEEEFTPEELAYIMVYIQDMAGFFPDARTKEDKRKILIEMAKDGWQAVEKKYNVPPLVLHEWRKEFTPEELGLAPE